MSKGVRTMHNGTKWSLVIFILVCSINMLGLAVDEALKSEGLTSITDHVRAHPWLGIPIVLLQAIATVCLAYHFWARPHI